MAATDATITLFAERLPTPIGTLLLLTDEQDRVRVADWSDYTPRMERLLQRHYGWDARHDRWHARAVPSPARRALEAYFDGALAAIDAVPTDTGGTPFQQTVWRALRTIPVGHTWSYGQLAAVIGQPRAVRAVGLANGANPIGIVVPCHRVIGAGGSLVGYGGGLDRKRWLLAHEGAVTPVLPETRAATGSSA